MTLPPSPDQVYLEFSDKTKNVFAEYPKLEPLRYFIFKRLWIQRASPGVAEHLKHWLRPLWQRRHSRDAFAPADVLIWVESSRETSTETLKPIFDELATRGIRTELITYRVDHADWPESVRFEFPARALPPRWAKSAWNSLCEIHTELRQGRLRRAFYYRCANLQSCFDELDTLLGKFKPQIVVNRGNQTQGGAALIIRAKLKGVHSIVLQHGVMQPLYVPVIADHLVTWGELSTNILIDLGVPRKKLVSLGSPRHDTTRPSFNGRSKAALLDALQLPQLPTFVFFSNGNDPIRNGDAPAECARWLESIAKEFATEINVVVRLHPNENDALYRQSSHLHVTKAVPDLHTTIDGADWIGSLCSTVMYEALLYMKPVWQLEAPDWPGLADNWKRGLATRITSLNELRQMTQRVLREGPHGVGSVCEPGTAFANHGSATAAVADFIQSHLEKET